MLKYNKISTNDKFVLFSNTNFIYLIVGQLVSNCGDYLFLPTILWIAATLTKDNFSISLINVFETLPGIVLGLFIGVIIDNLDKRKVMIVSDFARAGVVLVLALLYITNRLEMWHIYLVSFLLAALGRFFTPSKHSILPNVVEAEHLQKANSYSTMGDNLMNVLGSSTCGIIFGFFGALGSVIINCISYIFSGTCIALIKKQDDTDIKREQVTISKVIKDLVDGFKYLKKNPALVAYLSMSLIINIAFATFILIPVFIKNDLSLGLSQYGIIEGISATGMVLGALMLTKVNIKKPFLFMGASELLISLCIIIMGLFPKIWVLGTSRFFIGILLAIFNITFITEFQKVIDNKYRGRVFTISYFFSTIFYPISSAISGYFANIVGISIVWIIVGVFVALVTLLIVCVKHWKITINEVM